LTFFSSDFGGVFLGSKKGDFGLADRDFGDVTKGVILGVFLGAKSGGTSGDQKNDRKMVKKGSISRRILNLFGVAKNVTNGSKMVKKVCFFVKNGVFVTFS
jgi:hypothetical protein